MIVSPHKVYGPETKNVKWEMLDNEFELMKIARQIAEISAKVRFTIRDDEIFRLETCRRVGLDELGTDRFDEAAQAAGVSPHALRTFINDHDQKGHVAGKDREAWSQAKRKVAATFSRASLLMSLLVLMSVTSAVAHQLKGDSSTNSNCTSGHPVSESESLYSHGSMRYNRMLCLSC